MLKIGDFSKLSQVTVKALRYYDDLGLLKPMFVESFSGYRFYSVEQLPRLNRIIALKELGFSLTQIADLLENAVSAEQIKGMLLLKQAEIERLVEAEMERLSKVKARLQQIEKEGQPSSYDVIIKPISPLMIASIRKTVPTYGHIGNMLHELFGYLGAQQIVAAGPPFAIYHDGDHRDVDVDVEVAVPINQLAESEDQANVAIYQLPAVMMVTTLHTGSYELLSLAYSAILNWIEENNYRIQGPCHEIYLCGPGDDTTPDHYVTEIQFPIVKA